MKLITYLWDQQLYCFVFVFFCKSCVLPFEREREVLCYICTFGPVRMWCTNGLITSNTISKNIPLKQRQHLHINKKGAMVLITEIHLATHISQSVFHHLIVNQIVISKNGDKITQNHHTACQLCKS